MCVNFNNSRLRCIDLKKKQQKKNKNKHEHIGDVSQSRNPLYK